MPAWKDGFLRGVFALALLVLVPMVGGCDRTPLSVEENSSQKSEQTICLAHEGAVLSLAVSPNGQLVASGGTDRVIRLWDAETGQMKQELQGHNGRVHSVAISPDGQFLVSGSGDGTVRRWRLDTGEEIGSSLSDQGKILSVAIAADGQKIAASTNEGSIAIWNLKTGQRLQQLKIEGKTQLYTVVFNPINSNVLFSGGNDGKIQMWDLERRKTRPVAKWGRSEFQQVFSLTITRDGRQLASGSDGDEDNVLIWDVIEQNVSEVFDFNFNGHSFVVSAVSFSLDGQQLASGSYDETIKIWNLNAGSEERRLTTLRGHQGFVYAVEFLDQAGQSVVSGGYDGTVRIWNVEKATEEQQFCPKTSEIESSQLGDDQT
jgi:WD40 repeat protein